MMTDTKMRALADRLLAYEANLGKTLGSSEPATLVVYEKLRRSLCEFAGVGGFLSLASRAMALAKAEEPSLGGVQLTRDGSLHGLGEMEYSMGSGKDHADGCAGGEGVEILIIHLLSLLLIFLGESLTLSLLRVPWPVAALDDRSSENGRKA
ncbi:MAG: hypothetical protein ACP5E2_14005 [Terracidiphilus sp.]